MSDFPNVTAFMIDLANSRAAELERRLGLFLARHPELIPEDVCLIERDGEHVAFDLGAAGLSGYSVERIMVFTVTAADLPEPSIATTYWVAYLPKENLS